MLLYFLVLTFLFTWTCFFAAPHVPTASGVMYLLGTIAPSIVALILTKREQGTAGVEALLKQTVQFPKQARWYVFALGITVAIKLSAAALIRAATGSWPAFGSESIALMFAAVAISVWVQAGEEIGWRGFALPRFTEQLGAPLASVVLGVIWALWHLPLFFVQASDTFHQSFPMFITEVTALSVVMAWLYWRTDRSLFIVMLLHASVNNTKDIVPSVVNNASNPWALSTSSVAWTAAALFWLLAIYCLLDMHRVRRVPDAVRALPR